MGGEDASMKMERRPETRSPPLTRAARLLGRFDYLRIIRNIAVGLGAAFVSLGIFVSLGLLGLYDLPYAVSTLNALKIGATNTLGLIAIVIPIGFSSGFAFGWGRTSHRWLTRSISTVYVEFFRSMPPLVLIAFAFLISTAVLLGIPGLADRIGDPNSFALSVSVLALAFHSGAYQAEIVRAGIQSVPTGQREAAEAIGLTKGKILFYVVLPQMFRISLPALSNEFASVIKDTSLLSAVGILDLAYMAQNLASRLIISRGNIDNIFLIYVEIALIYFVMTFVVSRILQEVERAFRVPGLEAAQL
ncbi:MAG TPA: amino acid ABC transporter permease [Thermoplasmata archaeon]|nr:amino acid ABC transporter permease [Thermoplasmata archaeon]